MNYTSRTKKLNRLSAQLYQRSLTTEAALVANLDDCLYKEAGIIDFIKEYASNPQVLEYVSLGLKIVGAIATIFPPTTAAGPAIVKATSLLDFAAAAQYYKSGQYLSCIFNILSGILAVPSGALNKFYVFMLSDDFIQFLIKFKSLKYTSDTAPAVIINLIDSTIPSIIDGLLNIFEGLTAKIVTIAAPIARAAGLKVEEVQKNISATLQAMSNDINSKLGVLI